MLASYGGAPQAIVPDNLKSAVTKASNYEPDINRNFVAFGLHYNSTILPTRSGNPKDKPLVKSAVRMTYRNIFFPLRDVVFFSLADLNEAIAKELVKLNDKKFTHRNFSRRGLFEKEEKTLLSSLLKERFERKVYRRYKVKKEGYVWLGLDKHYYSVPHQYKGKHVQIRANRASVEVYHNYKRIALHQRSSQVGRFTTDDKHLASNTRFVKNWSMDQFSEPARKIGPQTLDYVHKVFEHKAHPEQTYKVCMGLMKLAQRFGNQRMEKAC